MDPSQQDNAPPAHRASTSSGMMSPTDTRTNPLSRHSSIIGESVPENNHSTDTVRRRPEGYGRTSDTVIPKRDSEVVMLTRQRYHPGVVEHPKQSNLRRAVHRSPTGSAKHFSSSWPFYVCCRSRKESVVRPPAKAAIVATHINQYTTQRRSVFRR